MCGPEQNVLKIQFLVVKICFYTIYTICLFYIDVIYFDLLF